MRLTTSMTRGIFFALTISLLGCAEEPSTLDAGTLPQAPPTESAAAEAQAEDKDALRPAMDNAAYAELLEKLSEPNDEFFSDNFISNETSYLQVAQQLVEREALDDADKRGVYIGVGPEQNFTYIALSKPSMAYIVDIRRDNLVLQLLYKSAFDAATDRAHFLALLTGRIYDTSTPLPEGADIDQVLAHTERTEATAETFKEVHAELRDRIEKTYGIELDRVDRNSLRKGHVAFLKEGLDIRFKLKENSSRRYPSLRELLSAADQNGNKLGFLVRDDHFRLVQRMQRENRIVPVVGNFAGDRAMPALATHLTEQGDHVDYFYVSNVEQYLMVDGLWWKWQRNIAALPVDADSAFIRCYLDQGKRHPRQMAGHRTASTLHPIAAFNERKKPYRSFHALASDNLIPAK